MCTVSVLPFDHGEFSLMMNRDESPSRPAALNVRRGHSDGGLEHAAPIDPESGGTWVALNARGVAFALMNQYPEAYPRPTGLRSRGEIIPAMIGSLSAHEAASRLSHFDPSSYPPFFLLALDGRGPYHAMHWDGDKKELLSYPREARLFASSSFEAEEVLLGRQEQFEQMLGKIGGVDAETVHGLQREFHASHHPARGAYSVCLHRDDARSMSITEISVRGLNARLNYHAGPPCEPAVEREEQLA